jgi:hypothetical protein
MVAAARCNDTQRLHTSSCVTPHTRVAATPLRSGLASRKHTTKAALFQATGTPGRKKRFWFALCLMHRPLCALVTS